MFYFVWSTPLRSQLQVFVQEAVFIHKYELVSLILVGLGMLVSILCGLVSGILVVPPSHILS